MSRIKSARSSLALVLLIVFFGNIPWTTGSIALKDIHVDAEQKFTFAKYYGHHMVLQQAPSKAVIWGHAPWSSIGQTVTASVGNMTQTSTTVIQGPLQGKAIWKILLPPVHQHGPFKITVILGASELHLYDVLFGDVWLCSGQSNMVFSMVQVFNSSEELKEVSSYPDIRVFTVALKFARHPLYELLSVEEKWSLPTPATIGHNKPFSYFSAVCWLYGKYLYKTLQYPIGLVDTDWGGTPVESWSSPDALANCGLSDNPHNEPQHAITRFEGPKENSVLWNSMIHPLLNMTIYGAIWYQGEANAGRPNNYNCTFPAMISDWRTKFNEGSLGQTSKIFPFGFVQLSARQNDSSIVTGFPDIRWHQTADFGYVPNPLMQNVFMSVAMDLPDYTSPYKSVHPRDKQDVAWRLTLSGLSVAYNASNIKFQGPMITAFYINTGFHTLNLDFDNGTSPILVRSTEGFEVCCSSNNQSYCTSDTDPRWTSVPITKHDTRSVTLSYNTCARNWITGLRYAWRESPCSFKQCAVYSQENELPAPPFVINGLIGVKIKTSEDIQRALTENKL